MRAVILAAGASRRLRQLTLDRPKCMIELAGRSLVERQLAALAQEGIVDVTIVTGYMTEKIEALGYPTRYNPRFAETNMVASLMCAADRLDGSDDVLISYGDLVYEPRVVRAVRDCGAALATAVDRSWLRLWSARTDDPLADAETLRLGSQGQILELGGTPTGLDEIEGQYMGVTCVRAATAPRLVAFHDRLDRVGPYEGRDRANMYMTSFLQRLIDDGMTLQAVLVDGGWLEIDTPSDLDAYVTLHARGALRDLCDLSTTD